MGSSDVKYPWPSTINVANFVTVRPCLEEDERSKNFSIWKQQMLCLLESQGLLGFVDGKIPPPEKSDATVPAAEEKTSSSNVESEQMLMWRRSDRLVKGWILGSIGKDALDAVWELETARDVWLELDKIFKHKAANVSAPTSKHQSLGNADAPPPAAETGGATLIAIEGATSVPKIAGGDYSRYVPLYKAALRGDWETGKDFFDKDREGAASSINSFSETALEVAIVTGKANDFVKKLVDLMTDDELARKDSLGNTALHFAARVGNIEAAEILITKNPNLLYVVNIDKQLPIVLAAIFGHKETLVYLMSMSKQNVENNPFEGQLGIVVLAEVISSEFFDIALDLVEKYPDLARLIDFGNFRCALSVMASMSSVFPSGESFSWWQKLIYSRIPLKQPKRRASQATSVAADIENVGGDAPVHNKCSISFHFISGVTKKMEIMLWRVIEQLVPQVKSIRHKKTKHQQAIQLLNYLCQQMLSLTESQASLMFNSSIIKAASLGISEIVEMIIDMYPMATFAMDNGKNVFLLAASNRFEKVFNLIYNMSDRKILLSNSVDIQRNNLMHMCAKLAPPNRLNLVPGAALQMQRELQWFKEMEKFVRPDRQSWLNIENQTAKMLFTKEHQELKAEGEKWMKDTANACTITAALTATVVFAAAFTVPGGLVEGKGIPIFLNNFAFVLFAISDAVSLFTSVTSLLMFLSILTSRYAEEDFLYVLPKRLTIGLLSLFISITFMMVAFSATLHLVFRGRMGWILIPVVAFACLPITSFVLLQFPLLVDVVYSTYGPGIFGKKSDRFIY